MTSTWAWTRTPTWLGRPSRTGTVWNRQRGSMRDQQVRSEIRCITRLVCSRSVSRARSKPQLTCLPHITYHVPHIMYRRSRKSKLSSQNPQQSNIPPNKSPGFIARSRRVSNRRRRSVRVGGRSTEGSKKQSISPFGSNPEKQSRTPNLNVSCLNRSWSLSPTPIMNEFLH